MADETITGEAVRFRSAYSEVLFFGRFWRLLVVASISLSMVMAVPGDVLAQAHGDRQIDFDIPAKPLAAALRDYGKASGLEVFYDGSLAVGQESAGVRGRFTALAGLKELLRGTSYIPRSTDIHNTLTIVPGPSVESLRASFARYQPYFSDIQARLSEALCVDDMAAVTGEMIKFQLWLDPSGSISEARVVGPHRGASVVERFEQRARGLSIGRLPPNGLPQPVTMVVYPPLAGEVSGCLAGEPRQAGR